MKPGSAEWIELIDTMIHDSWVFDALRQGLGDRMCPAALAFAVRTTSGGREMRESVHQLVESLFDEIEKRRAAGTLTTPADVTSELIPATGRRTARGCLHELLSLPAFALNGSAPGEEPVDDCECFSCTLRRAQEAKASASARSGMH